MKIVKNPLIMELFIFPVQILFEVIQKGYKQTIKDQTAFDTGIDAMIKIAELLTEESNER